MKFKKISAYTAALCLTLAGASLLTQTGQKAIEKGANYTQNRVYNLFANENENFARIGLSTLWLNLDKNGAVVDTPAELRVKNSEQEIYVDFISSLNSKGPHLKEQTFYIDDKEIWREKSEGRSWGYGFTRTLKLNEMAPGKHILKYEVIRADNKRYSGLARLIIEE